MRALLLSGLGPAYKNEEYLRGGLFDASFTTEQARSFYGVSDGLEGLTFRHGAETRPLLRKVHGRGSLAGLIDPEAINAQPIPHLTTLTLRSILDRTRIEYDHLDLRHVWEGSREPDHDSYTVVLLSTTFIWDRRSLARAIAWVDGRFGGATLVLGGQYSNLKYPAIVAQHPEVDYVVRGDGERAIGLLLRHLEGDDRVAESDVPNLVIPAGDGRFRMTGHEFVDFEQEPAPLPAGLSAIVPYESMRGCPYACRFCSFPHASPKWRYRSAERIADDWRRYRDDFGARHIRASDSTFTVPPKRMRELLELLPDVGIGWEGFSRANAIKTKGFVDALAAAGCRTLSIGFESMSDNTLRYMDKRVRAADNRRAFELLDDSDVGYRCSFIVGYPGETPDDFAETHSFITGEYSGYFILNVFTLQDETMPVWDDVDRFGIRILDPEDPDYAWTHDGMDVATARRLMQDTLETARWSSDAAVHLLWQRDFETPLIPGLSASESLRLEKTIERYAMLPTRTHPGSDLHRFVVSTLESFGVAGA